MAKLNGILPIEGTLDNMSFYKTRDGVIVRKKSSLNGKKMEGNPAFDLLRKRNQEFTTSGQHAKLLRKALKLVLHGADNRMSGRLTRQVLRGAQADTTKSLGQRTIIDGAPELLEGFEFNNAAPLDSVFEGDYTVAVNRQLGMVTIDIPAFNPVMLEVPSSATHYCFIAGAAAVNFATGAVIKDSAATGHQAIGAPGPNGTTLSTALTGLGTEPVFVVLGLQFYLSVNNEMHAVSNGAFNAIRMVRVDV